jgi:hypothetical protein
MKENFVKGSVIAEIPSYDRKVRERLRDSRKFQSVKVKVRERLRDSRKFQSGKEKVCERLRDSRNSIV